MIDPAAGVVLRRRRAQTNLRTRLPLWADGVRIILDQIGPFTRTVSDAALALSALSGRDPMDSTSSPEAVPDFTLGADRQRPRRRVGVPRAFVAEGVDDAVRRAFDEAPSVLRDAGATLVDVDLPHARYAIPVYYLICTAEASSNLARYDGVSTVTARRPARTTRSRRCTAGRGTKDSAPR